MISSYKVRKLIVFEDSNVILGLIFPLGVEPTSKQDKTDKKCIRQQNNQMDISNETQVKYSITNEQMKNNIKINDKIKTEQNEYKQILITSGNYICEWNNCKSTFHTAAQVYNHVCNFHLLNKNTSDYSNGQLCQWVACDLIKRQKWSLVNHLQERHCNEISLQQAKENRERGILPVSSQAINSIISTKDAALLAIQRNQKKNKDEFLVIFFYVS